MRAVAASAALALENERLEAELRARLDELQTSRSRLVEVSMFERRRLERDLHDGAQQRLVALSLQLGLAKRRLEEGEDGAAGAMLDAARDELARALEELRELARGIHPAVLTDRGLEPALEALAERAPLPVSLDQMPAERLPAAGRGGRLLRRGRGAHERRQVRRARPRRGARPAATAPTPSSRSATTASAAPIRRSAPACAAWPTASPRSTAASRSIRPPGEGTTVQGRGPVRVVLADDSLLLREGVARLLEEAGLEVVAQAGDAEDLLRKVGAHKPDVAIVDVRMPPTHTDEGLRAAAEIRDAHPGIGVLVLSQYIEEAYAMELLARNAEGVGYLLKDRVADLERFVDAVRRVGEGGSALDPEVVSRLLGRRRQRGPAGRALPARARGARR